MYRQEKAWPALQARANLLHAALSCFTCYSTSQRGPSSLSNDTVDSYLQHCSTSALTCCLMLARVLLSMGPGNPLDMDCSTWDTP